LLASVGCFDFPQIDLLIIFTDLRSPKTDLPGFYFHSRAYAPA
jgi:hypothetical protein